MEARATPGPWYQAFEEGKPTDEVCVKEEGEDSTLMHCYDGPHDANFIASSRNSHRLDRCVGDGTRETWDWLLSHGLDPRTFAYRESRVVVDWAASAEVIRRGDK